MAKIMVQYGRPQSFLLNEICMVIFWQDYYGKRQFEKVLVKHGWEKIPNWECLFVHREKEFILVCVCGWHKIGWKETKSWSDVESTQQRSRFGRTYIFLGSCIFGYSTTIRSKQRYCGQLQSLVRIANFSGVIKEIAILSKSSYFFMVLWHGWSCKEVCGTILWFGKQNDSTTLQSICSMQRWPPFQKRKKQNLLENCQIHALKLFWNAYTWQELDDLIFYGQWTNLQGPSQNGPKLVTKAWIAWFLTFIIHVNTNTIVLWIILQNNPDWDCFKTLTSKETLKIKNPLREEHYAFLEVIHLFQDVGCLRNKHQFHTTQQNL